MNKRISLIVQEEYLERMFPGSHIKRFREEYISWVHTITPSPMSATYTVKLEYQRYGYMNFYVLDPKPLSLANDAKFLPHVYSTPEQRLCLFFPDGTEWNHSMLYTTTIIPWAFEWLVHYEIWVGTNEWHGGGTKHSLEN